MDGRFVKRSRRENIRFVENMFQCNLKMNQNNVTTKCVSYFIPLTINLKLKGPNKKLKGPPGCSFTKVTLVVFTLIWDSQMLQTISTNSRTSRSN